MRIARLCKYMLLIFAACLVITAGTAAVFGQAAAPTGAGGVAATTTGAAAATAASSSVAGGSASDISNALNQASLELENSMASAIPGALSLAQNTSVDTDRLAGGLAMIAITLAGLTFAGTHHPIGAWGDLLREILVLGFFASLYTSYSTVAPAFCSQFQYTSNLISSGPTAWSGLSNLVGSLFQTADNYVGMISLFNIKFGLIIAALMYVLVGIIVLITMVLVIFFTQLGTMLLAVGVVLGKYEIALGMWSVTRSYFKSWLDYMVGSGLYIVVGTTVSSLALASMATRMNTIATQGTHQYYSAFYSLVVAVFAAFLALEIPKIAGTILGGAASASGSMPMNLAAGGLKSLYKKATGKGNQ